MGARKGCQRGHYRGEDSTQCVVCKDIKPLASFTASNPTICRRCKYGYHVLRTYGITLAQLESMLLKQRGLCAICERRKPKYVDHKHGTTKARGILCQPCNTALGAFFESAEIMKRAIAYVVAATEE